MAIHTPGHFELEGSIPSGTGQIYYKSRSDCYIEIAIVIYIHAWLFSTKCRLHMIGLLYSTFCHLFNVWSSIHVPIGAPLLFVFFHAIG